MDALCLSVFGTPQLIQTHNQHSLLSAPLPMLIATYMAIECQGEAKNRETICRLLYPLQPQVPQNFLGISQDLYQHIWTQLANAENPSLPFTIGNAVVGKLQKDHPQENIQDAHAQLHTYAIIQQQRKTALGWQYVANEQFARYLNKTEIEKNGSTKDQLTRKTFSAHIGTIRQCVREAIPKIVQNAVPMGKPGRGKQTAELIVRLPCTAEYLQQAVQELDFDFIQHLYTGEFLADIEDKLRADLWLAPELRSWIFQRRTEFAAQVTNALLEIIKQTDSHRLRKAIKAYCKATNLGDAPLQQALVEQSPPNTRTVVTPEKVLYM